jgi:cell division protein FtsI (penicillin-binding protein 3)
MTDHAVKQFHRKRMTPERRRKNFLLFLALVLLLGSGAFLFHAEKFSALAERLKTARPDRTKVTTSPAPYSSARGNIYDRNFRPLAATYKTHSIYALPLEMEDVTSSAEVLEEILGLNKNKLQAALKSERGFVWVAKGIDQEAAETIQQRNIKGIHQVIETKRLYPNAEKAAHAVGFVENEQGLDGIEFQYNALLRGDELSTAELETLHFTQEDGLKKSIAHLVLNLDLMVQTKIERFLERRIRITGASSGTVLVMQADTGAILAMASLPSFNPNRYWEFSSTSLNNHLLTEAVYPGELALIFQQAAAINFKNEKRSQADENLAAAASIPEISPDKRKRRKLSVAPVVDEVDPQYLARFAQSLGFEQRLFTDLPLKEEIPSLPLLALNDPSFHASALRLLTAFTTLVNGGLIVSPHLLNNAYQKDSDAPFQPAQLSSGQIAGLHPETSRDLADFLASKWLKISSRNRVMNTPMFFEAHRFPAFQEKTEKKQNGFNSSLETGKTPGLSQSIMLGAIPGDKPELTMVAVLTYPDSDDESYPDALESLGDKLSILAPDRDLIKIMLHVNGMEPPKPSSDFWDNEGTMMAKILDPFSSEDVDSPENAVESMKSMPDVTGKSLRAGLQVLQHYNMDIKLVGSGRIVSQKPPAGTTLKNINQCILEMQQKI